MLSRLDLRGPVIDAAAGVRLSVKDSTTVESAVSRESVRDALPRQAPKPSLESTGDIPARVDIPWLERHEHLLEWTPDGKKLRLKRPVQAAQLNAIRIAERSSTGTGRCRSLPARSTRRRLSFCGSKFWPAVK